MLQGKAIGAFQLYPRSFWMWFAGGMTVTEFFLLGVWIVLHCVMLWNWYKYYVKSYDYGRLTCLTCVCTCT